MSEDSQEQDLGLNFGFGLQGRFSSPGSIMGLDFKVMGQPRSPRPGWGCRGWRC